MRRRTVPFLAAVLLTVAVGCSSTPTRSDGRLQVVATTTQLTDFARVIGGTHVDVHGLLKANVDPHDYEPSPADLDEISDARVIVKNGVDLERWLDRTIAAADPSGTIVDASTGVAVRDGDPHIWQDPRNAVVMADDIERAFARVDPAHAADYAANLARYRAQLEQLDRQVAARLDTLPNRRLVTNHDAFGYYVRRYHLDFVGSIIPSFDTSAELSAGQVHDLVEQIRATHTKAVFSETSVPAKTAEAIGREAHVKVVAGEDSLYGDTLGPPGSDGDTYLKMVRHNTREIVTNLR